MNIWMKYAAFVGVIIGTLQVQAGGMIGSQMTNTVTKILTEKPLKPSEALSKYNLSFAETFLKSKNRFSKLQGKTTGNVKAVSLNVEESDQWEWGVNYLYSTIKFHGVEDDRVEYVDSHDVVPYGTYFFTPDAYVMVQGGGRYSYVKIRQNAGTPASGSSTASAGILGAEVGLEKNFGLWSPSVNAEVLYENERGSHHTLSDGSFTRKEWAHFLKGSVGSQLSVNIHENFQPYVKAGGETILRRSKNYTLQKWNGWSLGGGVILFSSKTWKAALDYEHGFSHTGERGNLFMLKFSGSF